MYSSTNRAVVRRSNTPNEQDEQDIDNAADARPEQQTHACRFDTRWHQVFEPIFQRDTVSSEAEDCDAQTANERIQEMQGENRFRHACHGKCEFCFVYKRTSSVIS